MNLLTLVLLLQLSVCQQGLRCPNCEWLFNRPKVENPTFDVVLYKYSGYYNGNNDGALLKKHNCKRVISYPDSYMIIMIPKTEYKNVEKTIGKERVLQISDKLED